MRIDALQPNLDAPAARRELDRIREQVPHDLLEPIRIPRYRTDIRIDDRQNAHALCFRPWHHRREGVVEHNRKVERLHIETDLACGDA